MGENVCAVVCAKMEHHIYHALLSMPALMQVDTRPLNTIRLPRYAVRDAVRDELEVGLSVRYSFGGP
jgi:hypothetical protein